MVFDLQLFCRYQPASLEYLLQVLVRKTVMGDPSCQINIFWKESQVDKQLCFRWASEPAGNLMCVLSKQTLKCVGLSW